VDFTGIPGRSAAYPIELSSDEEEYPLTPIMLKTGGRASQDNIHQRPSIISIEGIPGSGKSAVIDLLAERFENQLIPAVPMV